MPSYVDSLKIEAQANEQAIVARSLKRYYLSSSKIQAQEGLVLGFGEADSKKILKAAKILFQILSEYPG
jgi:DNA-binding transcriptional MocR family regulator